MSFNPPSSRSLQFDIKYFKNGDRYDDVVTGCRIGNHPCTVNWHHALQPWLTLNCPRSRTPAFHFKYLEYREFAHKVGISIIYRQYAICLDTLTSSDFGFIALGYVPHIPQNVLLVRSFPNE